jgi:hypothetical protein
MAVGIYIWYLAGLKKSNCVTLPTTKVDAFGVDRFAQYRALTALEKAGLVSLERHRGRHPIITLKATPAKTEGGDRNA